MWPKNANFLLLQKTKGSDVMCNNLIQNKAIPAVFHNSKTEKFLMLGFTIIQSERFTVVYIDNLTKCRCVSSALRLTLTKKKKKKKKKGGRKQNIYMKKESENVTIMFILRLMCNFKVRYRVLPRTRPCAICAKDSRGRKKIQLDGPEGVPNFSNQKMTKSDFRDVVLVF